MSAEIPEPQRLREQDADAWNLFYRTTRQRTWRVLYQVTGATEPALEELHQEVWLSAIESIESFDATRGTAQDWILGIARLKGLTYLRQRYRNRVVCFGGSFDLPDRHESSPDLPEADERLAILRASIESLPEHWQYVLRLKYEEGLSVQEISELTGTTPKAIESLLSRARQRLREIYESTCRQGASS